MDAQELENPAVRRQNTLASPRRSHTDMESLPQADLTAPTGNVNTYAVPMALVPCHRDSSLFWVGRSSERRVQSKYVSQRPAAALAVVGVLLV